MNKSAIKKALTCVTLAAATAGIWYGATRLSGRNIFLQQEVREEETLQDTEEEEEVPQEEVVSWTMPEVLPDEDDYTGRIMVGDFGAVLDADPALTAQMQQVFAQVRPTSRYIETDTDGDGTSETVWLAEMPDTLSERVVAVFVHEARGERMILWDPGDGEDEFYLCGGERLYYIRKNDWIISEYHCTEVLFDSDYEMYGGEALSMYLVEDADLYESGVDAAVRRRMTFIDGAGVWYQSIDAGMDAQDARRVHADEWLALFLERTGTQFEEVSPAFEAKRCGIETGVGLHVETIRRSGYASLPFVEIVRYPQVTRGEKRETINRLLQDAAYTLSVGEEHAQEASAYLRSLNNNASLSQEGQVYYRVANNAEDMISVQFGLTRTTQGEAPVSEVSLMTIEKASGRQIQIGDLTSIDAVIAACEAGYGELFFLSESGNGLIRDEDASHDGAWMREVVERTRNVSDRWKNIGLDEQYLYLGVVTGNADGQDAILRIPRWRLNMSSPGHMELLTMHPAYPYLRDTLDSAQSLTVRKVRDGYDITFLTADGGRVQANLHDTVVSFPEAYGTDALRDLLIYEYPDVTGIVIGSLLAADSSEPINYYSVDSSLGAIGRVILETSPVSYEITQMRFNTNRGMLDTESDLEGGLRMEVYGILHEDAYGYAVWHNLEEDSYRLTRSIAGDARFVFELSPADTGFDEREEEGESLRVVIYPEDAGHLADVYEISPEDASFVFRDLNNDGYDDLTIGTIDPLDHRDEYNYLYAPAYHAYAEGPEELREECSYRFEPASGGVVIEKDGRFILYETLEDMSLRRIRTLRRTETGSGVRVTMTEGDADIPEAKEEEGEEEEGRILIDAILDEDVARNIEDDIDTLFRTRRLMEIDVTDTARGAATAPDAVQGSRYIVVSVKTVPDIIAPYDVCYVFLVDREGAVLRALRIPDPEEAVSAGRLIEAVEEEENGEAAISFTFALVREELADDAPEDTEPLEETPKEREEETYVTRIPLSRVTEGW